jgi:hypothetical protein
VCSVEVVKHGFVEGQRRALRLSSRLPSAETSYVSRELISPIQSSRFHESNPF